MNIENKTVAITGSNRGIGWALAQEMAGRKASLSLIVRKRSSITAQMIQELKSLGSSQVKVFELDLLDLKAVGQFTEEYWKTDRADVLINNAGLLTGGLLENQKDEDILNLITVNISSLTLLSRGFLKHFLKQNSGKIVNNASVMGEMCFPAASTYGASKSYVIGFTEALRQELRSTPVTTLLMYTPGVKTDMYDEIFELYGGHLDLDFLSSIPAKEWAQNVCDTIEAGGSEVRPKGTTGFGLTLSRHFPKLFESVVAKKFHR